MENYRIVNEAFTWLQKSLVPDQKPEELKQELINYLKTCYGDLVAAIYGELDDVFICFLVDKIFRMFKEGR